MSQLPETKEDYSSKIPALATLMALGWEYLSPTDCLRKRGGHREVLLKDELVAVLQTRRFTFRGRAYGLSSNAIDTIVRELSAPSLQHGLTAANRQLYEKLCLGITVTEFIDGKKCQPTIPIIDWQDMTNNHFQVTEEMEVLNTQGTSTRRPDIVGYVNGIPLVVIEAKRPDSENPNKNRVEEGVSQMIRNQYLDEIPVLFSYAQLLLSISGDEGLYGTTETKAGFWGNWKDEAFGESHFTAIKNTPLSDQQQQALFANKPKAMMKYFKSLWSKPQLATKQDHLLISLLTPERLLEFIRFSILFDKKKGKIAARYQQFFAVKQLLARVDQRNHDGGREGGIIWHTTGSGKSFSMVFLTKALLLHPSLSDCRILVVTDRTDLEKQLANTFLSGGAYGSDIAAKKEGTNARAKTGKDLAKRIGQGNERIIFSLLQKFNTASKQPECFNPSDNIVVLVDEGHRSHGGENHERMRKSLPNASFIAFTGTPLLKEEKVDSKFGPILHSYTMRRATEDKAIAPLLYEERKQLLDVNAKAIDKWFDKITARLTPEQQRDLKKKFSRKEHVYGAEHRIELIALDIADHFSEHFKKLDLGLKGQLATDSKRSAIRYKKALDATGVVTSAVIISPPDTREGHQDTDESNLPEVQQWWKRYVTGNPEQYEKDTIDNFATDGEPDLLIVVDKLLTGFDEPKNAVLYIDKPLKEHNLIQAVARVNRLHKDKQYGLLIDYRGILPELDVAILGYQKLEEQTQGGYDIEDLEGLYAPISSEYKKLPKLHKALWNIFANVKNRTDREQYRQILMPKYVEDDDGHEYDARQHVREDFYEALKEFGLCLKLALSSRSFFEDEKVTEAMIQTYKEDLRWFVKLRNIARQDAHETVDYSAYDEQIRRLVDKHVVGEEVVDPEGVMLVHEMGTEQARELMIREDNAEYRSEQWSDEKTRNETDTIKTRMKKTIEQELATDPYAQKVFSELLKETISEAAALFDYPHKQYTLFVDLEAKLQRCEVNSITADFGDNRHAQAYYGVFRLVLGEQGLGDDDKQVVEAYAIDEVVKTAIAENSLNIQNVEAQIRKQLLSRLFTIVGLENAKAIIDHVVDIVRKGIR